MNRTFSFVSVILLILILFGIYYFWIPQYQKASILGLQLEKKRETIKENEKYLKELNDLFTSLSDYSEEIAKIDAALPTDVSMPSLFNFAQISTAENGLTLMGINYGPVATIRAETTEAGIKKIPFS